MAEKENYDDAPAPRAPETRGKCLSLKRSCKMNSVDPKKTKESDEKFSFDITTDDLAAFQKGECPANTARSMEWSFMNFEVWQIARNERCPTEQCPADILKCTDCGSCVSGCVNSSREAQV